ncbi:MAG: diacylglycerol/lipid kinase family protein [Candidatus Heimdallarchaeota archaeon]
MKFICNPVTYGGKARKKWPKIIKTLKDAGLDFEIEWTKCLGDATRITKESVDDHDILVGYGGDGTINEILTGIGQTGFKNTLAIFPAGRGNDNAFNVRQTGNTEDIIDMLNKKEHRFIDCMSIDDGERYAMGICGAGIDGLISELVTGKSTRISYNISLVRSIFMYRPRHMHVSIDNDTIVRDLNSLSIMICNGQRAGNGKMIAPDAVIDDGLLDIVILGETNVIDTLVTSSKLGKGTHVTHPKCEIVRGKKIEITSNAKKRVPAHAMGEILGALPHTFECLHKKVKILKMSDEILAREGWTNAKTFSENL